MAKKTPTVPSKGDTVQVYLDDVSRHDMITREQEVELSTTFRSFSKKIAVFEKACARVTKLQRECQTKPGNKTIQNKLAAALRAKETAQKSASEGLAAREVFIKANLRLVVYYAHKFNTWSSLDLSDLIQEGNLGLMKALEKFDPDKGYKFSTYASWWIKQSMNRATQRLGSEIRIPAHRLEHIDKLAEGRNHLRSMLNREPTYEELEDYLNISLEKLQEADMLPRITASIWSPIEDSGDTRILEETMQDEAAFNPEAVIVEVNGDDLVKRYLEELPDRDYEIFKYRYGFEGEETHSLEQIGKKVGLTRERVRQILKKWHKKFMARAEKDGLYE